MAEIPVTKLTGQSKGGKGEKKVKKEKKGKKEKTKTESDDDEEEEEEEEEEEKEEEESDVEVHHHTNIPMQYIVNTTALLTFILLSSKTEERGVQGLPGIYYFSYVCPRKSGIKSNYLFKKP